MNQDSSFPPMLPPSTELGALLFAALPCLQESYRPFVSFAYHMTELTKLKNVPSFPPLTGLSGIESLIADKDAFFRSLTFYGKMFQMPFLSAIATLLQGLQFYQTYKDILPGLFSGTGNSEFDPTSVLGNMAGLFSGLSGFNSFSSHGTATVPPATEAPAPDVPIPDSSDNTANESSPTIGKEAASSSDDFYSSLYALLTPEQQKIYEQLMHTE